MSSALALSIAPETKWTVVKGPMKGAVRLMSQTQFSIGRSTDCEFVIVNDPKCSRKHATILVSPQGVEAIAENDKNPLYINGRETIRSPLNDGDVLTLGDTEIQFNAAARRLDPAHMAVFNPQGHGLAAQPRNRVSRVKKSNSGRLVLYFIIGIFFLFLMTPTAKKKKTIDPRTEQQIQNDIEAANKLKEAADAAANKKLDESMTSRQAQENYVRGFRDYKKGQYERSLVSFQACLALSPEHVLCNRYMRLAQRRFNELIQYEMVLGRKYRDQNQFNACRAAFRNVMVMVKDANSSAYKEAKANYEACNAFVEGRF